MKKCTKCKEVKNKSAFYKDKHHKDLLTSQCKECLRKYGSSPKVLERDRVIYQKRKKELKQQQLIRDLKDWRYVLLRSSRTSAKMSNLSHSIKLKDIVIPEYCPLLGFKLTRIKGGQIDTNPSIDRIDSSKGYEPENIQVISIKANRMKSNASVEELLLFAENIKKIYDI
jgi:hypothetical protein